jgi:hypothetical protein
MASGKRRFKMAMGIVVVRNENGSVYAVMINRETEADAKENIEYCTSDKMEEFIRYPAEGENECMNALSGLYSLDGMGSALDDLIRIAFEAGRDHQRSVIKKEIFGER